ncbi:MAG: DUF4304 domain-containing protein [Campylobacter sp.]|nr:DUF4304 domain-containing protein [Campylobacter sp.]
MKKLKIALKSKGYLQVRKTNDYCKTNEDFLIAVNFQKKSSGEYYFINVGIQPRFLSPDIKTIEEIDCVLRTRMELSFLVKDGEILEQNVLEFTQKLAELECEYLKLKSVFTAVEPQRDLANDKLFKFMITKVGLCKIYVQYFASVKDIKSAIKFAKYGLSITPKTAKSIKFFFTSLNESLKL